MAYTGKELRSTATEDGRLTLTLEDVTLDDPQEGSIFNFRVVFNAKYSLAPGGGIENVTLRDIRVSGDRLRPSIRRSRQRTMSRLTTGPGP